MTDVEKLEAFMRDMKALCAKHNAVICMGGSGGSATYAAVDGIPALEIWACSTSAEWTDRAEGKFVEREV